MIFRPKKKAEEKPEEQEQTPAAPPAPATPAGSPAVLKSAPTLKNFWISEKATDLKAVNQYSFLVSSNANKSEILKAVRSRFKVEVASVNTMRRKGKVKRWRAVASRRAGAKKAIVTLKAGSRIDAA